MKRITIFLLSAALIVCCLGIYIGCVRVGSGVNFVLRTVPEEERMQGNDSGEAYKLQLFYGETVNINTADARRLALLPEIGEVLAESIIAYREENGAFECIEDIMKVDGIGEGRFEAVRGLITTGERSG